MKKYSYVLGNDKVPDFLAKFGLITIMDYSSKGMNTNESVSEKLRVSSLN